jgi:hypothetical protein
MQFRVFIEANCRGLTCGRLRTSEQYLLSVKYSMLYKESRVSPSRGLISSNQISPLVKEEAPFQDTQKY